jgi:hypothetical protein
MIPNLDTWTIVLVGGWNPKIFRPEWVGKEVFDRKNIALEVPLSPGSSVLRYNSPEDSLVLIPSDDRLVIGIRKAEEPVLNKAAAIAKKVLDLLPYTPIGAIGVNFGFVEADKGRGVCERKGRLPRRQRRAGRQACCW